jgi:hypothetical protein
VDRHKNVFIIKGENKKESLTSIFKELIYQFRLKKVVDRPSRYGHPPDQFRTVNK